MKRLWIGVVLGVVCAHITAGAEPLTPSTQRALKVAQEAFTPAWAACGDRVTTQVVPQGGRDTVVKILGHMCPLRAWCNA
jgi:hypothetical protein